MLSKIKSDLSRFGLEEKISHYSGAGVVISIILIIAGAALWLLGISLTITWIIFCFGTVVIGILLFIFQTWILFAPLLLSSLGYKMISIGFNNINISAPYKEKNNLLSKLIDEPEKKKNEHLNSDLNAVSIQLQEIERDNAIELDKQQAETKKQLRNKEKNSTKKMGMTGKLKKLSEIFLISSGDLLIEMSKIGIHKVNEDDTISTNESKIIIRHLSDNGNASAQSMQAQYFYTDKKYKDAFNLWNKALLQEEILPKDTLGIITHNIGLAYYSGNGTTICKEEAVEWFIESSDIGGIQSQNSEYNLASMFLTGNGVKKNITKAKLWANKAITGENHEVSFNAKQILAKCAQIEVLDRVVNSDELPF
jgi:hypothetical protein